jgi:hypothetical protein
VVAEFTWPGKTTGIVTDWVVGVAEDVIAESARAETDGAEDVEAPKHQFPGIDCSDRVGTGGELTPHDRRGATAVHDLIQLAVTVISPTVPRAGKLGGLSQPTGGKLRPARKSHTEGSSRFFANWFFRRVRSDDGSQRRKAAWELVSRPATSERAGLRQKLHMGSRQPAVH